MVSIASKDELYNEDNRLGESGEYSHVWFRTKPGKGKDAGKFVGEYRFDPEEMTPDLFVTVINDSLKDISNVKISIELDSKHLLWVKTTPDGSCSDDHRLWAVTYTIRSVILPKASHLTSEIEGCFRFNGVVQGVIPRGESCSTIRETVIGPAVVKLANKTNDCLDRLMETTYSEKLKEIKHKELKDDEIETYYTLKEEEPEEGP
jgi:hypothetical protein